MVMLTFAVAAFAIVFTTVVNGAPSSSKSRGLLPSVKYCKNKNYGGACLETGVVSGSCQNVADGFDNTVTSLLMDSGLTCTIYCDAGCTGSQFAEMTAIDTPDLAKSNPTMDNCMTSFVCTSS